MKKTLFEKINDPSNKFYLLSELSKEDMEEIKNLVFNRILEIKIK